jgi:tRNA (guanosine-2'-O-)-methyltransferase
MKKIAGISLDNISICEQQELLAFLLAFVSANKQEKFRQVLQYRTARITVVLEDIFQSHNASAVLRSCDCFGIQDVHIVENRYRYEVNPDVTLGSAKWLNLVRYRESRDNTSVCLEELKKAGYSIVATSPHRTGFTPLTLPLDQKTALLFGTEKEGLTAEALDRADRFLQIPMFGFTESLNISVSVAIILHTLTHRLRESDLSWKLSDQEQKEVLLQWAASAVKKSDILIRDFLGRL